MVNPSTPIRNRDEAKSAGQFGTEVKNKAQETATAVTDKAKEMAATVTEKAKDVGSAVTQRAEEMASSLGHKTTEATSAVGASMKSLAGTVRENLPHEGMMGRASAAVADSLESGGRHLQEEGLRGLAEDLTNLIRRNPIPAVLCGIGIGFVIARFTRS
jgi:hypothetical protein